MLSTGFLLSSNILDLCSAKDGESVTTAYDTGDSCPDWIRQLCSFNAIKTCKDTDEKGKQAELTDEKTTTSVTDTVPDYESPQLQDCQPKDTELSNCGYGARSCSRDLEWKVGATSRCARHPLKRSLSSDELSRHNIFEDEFAFLPTPRNCCHWQPEHFRCSQCTLRYTMGNRCCPCCPRSTGYSRVDDVDPDDERRSLVRGGSKMDKDQYEWEQHLLDETVMKSGRVSQAAIVTYKNGDIRATAPRGFNPDRKGVKNILRALKGIDTSGISENGINLGSGTRVNTPGKLEEGKAIYGSDGKGGGCTIFKTKACVLIVFYNDGPAEATRLASEVAEYMEEQGY